MISRSSSPATCCSCFGELQVLEERERVAERLAAQVAEREAGEPRRGGVVAGAATRGRRSRGLRRRGDRAAAGRRS